MKVQLTILMIAGVLLGSLHVRINHHYCNLELESLALFTEAQPCEHARAKSDLPPCHKKDVDSERCCSTRSIYIKAQDWFTFKTESINVTIVKFITLNELPFHQSYKNFCLQYLDEFEKPPDIEQDLQVMFQVFII